MTDLIKRAPFSPLVTGGLLYLLTKAPTSVRLPVLLRLRELLSAQNIGRLVTTLKWLFAAGVVGATNTKLNELAYNNYRLTSTKKAWDWPNEIAVVTGASSGFGKLFALDLAAKGIKVAALDVNEPPMEISRNPRITFFVCDVTDSDAVKAVAKDIQQSVGHPSILINNAGIGKDHPIMESSPEWVNKIFAVNVISHFYLVQAFLPKMLEAKKGHIVTIASMASFISGAK